ncbi:MAG: undecaprenyl-diphosphate phosphatase [Nitrospinae bacterium]|nr:undecaprenyl-diphosphate phosphatase [Nitrospinota bacterium]
MSPIKSFILGIVQGLTEFLPISSSGHLVLFQQLFGLSEPEFLFDIMLHMGTLIAVMAIFRDDIWKIFSDTAKGITYTIKYKKLNPAFDKSTHIRFLLLIIIATIPTGLIGLLFKDLFERLFGSALSVGFMLLITGTLLFFSRWGITMKKDVKEMKIIDALIIGIVQGIAITPGISRSGITIVFGLWCGLNREIAARFSFLLSIPAILGAMLLEIPKIHLLNSGEIISLIIGTTTAMFVGYPALRFLLNVVKRGRLHHFAYYCWFIGILTITLSRFNLP